MNTAYNRTGSSMIRCDDLVRLKNEPRRYPEGSCSSGLGIVTMVRDSDHIGSNTITVVWPQNGRVENWIASALVVVS